MTRVQYIEYRRKDVIEERVLEQEKRKILCPECRTGRKKLWWNQGVVVDPTKGKAQQNNTQAEISKNAAKGEDKQRDVRKTFKILKSVAEHQSVTVKALLDNSTTEMFMDNKMAVKHEFKLQKLDRPVMVRNINRTNNSRRAIIHQVKVNVYYKSHVGRIRMDICN